jgi:hypothetical protein
MERKIEMSSCDVQDYMAPAGGFSGVQHKSCVGVLVGWQQIAPETSNQGIFGAAAQLTQPQDRPTSQPTVLTADAASVQHKISIIRFRKFRVISPCIVSG